MCVLNKNQDDYDIPSTVYISITSFPCMKTQAKRNPASIYIYEMCDPMLMLLYFDKKLLG